MPIAAIPRALWKPLCGLMLAALSVALAPRAGSACDGHDDGLEPAPDAGGWGEGFALLATGGGVHAVLDVTSEPQLPAGAPRLADRHSHVVHASAPDGAAPEGFAHWRASALEVVTDRGARCPASARRFEYRVDLIPDDYERERWSGISHDPDVVLTPLRGGELAAAVWQSTSERMITARLHVGGECEGRPLYVRELGAPSARVAVPLPVVPQRAAVLEAFRALPAYAQAQAEYARGEAGYVPDARASWEEYGPGLALQAFQTEGDQVLVSVAVPFAGCAVWDPALWAVFRLGDAPGQAPELVYESSGLVPSHVHLILEGDGGGYDFLIEDAAELGGLAVVRGQERLASWAPTWHGCRC